MGFSVKKFAKKVSNTVQVAAGVGLSLGTFGQSNKLLSKGAQESAIGKASTVAGKVATAGAVLVTGGYALTGGLAENLAAQTTGAGENMATIETATSAPTVYDQLKGILSGGVTTAVGNAVGRFTSPKPAPAPSESVMVAAHSVPVWGWVLGALTVAGLVFMVARKK